MKTDIHTITSDDGVTYAVRLDIFRMSNVEAIDVYDLPADLYHAGGYRIEAIINDLPAGTRFYSGNLGSHYWGDESIEVAHAFLADALRKHTAEDIAIESGS